MNTTLLQNSPTDFWPLLAAMLAWLVPVGFTLIATAGAPPERAWQTALAGVAGAGLATLAFFLVGFSLAFGGVGLIHANPGFNGLIWEWSALDAAWGPTWGMAGLAGWALSAEAATPVAYGLFLAHLPWVTTATLIPLLALRGRTSSALTLLGGLLVGGLLYPLATNWVWGGGWLAMLGLNSNLGHGLVDFAGAGTVFLVGGAVGLAGLLLLVPRKARGETDERRVEPLPPAHLPALATIGALFILGGSLGWAWANPLLAAGNLSMLRGAVNAMLAAAGGVLLPLGYTWFVTDRSDSLMTAKGLAAGAIVGAAVGPFAPPGAALALGALAGLLVPLLSYLVTVVLRLDDDTGLVAVHLSGSLLGLAGVGIWADGLAGAGWNGIGGDAFLGVAGQGVTGLRAAAGMTADWPGQFQAQLVGMVALLLISFLAATLVFGLLGLFSQGLERLPGQKQAAMTPIKTLPVAELPAAPEIESEMG